MKATKSARPVRALRPGWFFEPRLVYTRIAAPEFLCGLRALFVTDVHLRRWVRGERLDALVDAFAAPDADILFLTGDYAESRRDLRRFFCAMARLRPPLGAYAVPGNNDPRDRAALRALAGEAGIDLLVNETRRITLPRGVLEIGGCDEHKYGEPRTAGLFSDDGAYRILLSHFPVRPDCACDLMLSGHTHAGQICVRGISPYSFPFERKYPALAVHGLHRFGDMQLLVGAGIGVSKLPLRVNAEPEFHLLEFAPEAPQKNDEKPAARVDTHGVHGI